MVMRDGAKGPLTGPCLGLLYKEALGLLFGCIAPRL